MRPRTQPIEARRRSAFGTAIVKAYLCAGGACAAFAVVLVLASRAGAAALPEVPASGARIDVFYSEDCEHCRRMEKEFFTPLEAKGVSVARFEVSAKATAMVLLAIQALPEFQCVSVDSDGDLPLVFAGRYALEGEEAVRGNLGRVFILGGSELRTFPHTRAAVAAAAGGESLPGTHPGLPEIRMAYFENPGCSNCGAVNLLLSVAAALKPNLRIDRFRMDSVQSRLLLEAVAEKIGVPEEKRLVTPAVFVGKDFLIGEFDHDSLLALAGKYDATGAQAFWHDLDTRSARERIVERFRTMSTGAIVLAGFADGINPCAFATIVFMVVYLAGMGMQKARIAAAGAAFGLGVFLTYFAMGAGALGAVGLLGSNPWAKRAILAAGGTAALVFGLLSVRDYFAARRASLKESVLRISDATAARVRLMIARFARSRWAICGAFASGAAISLVEVVCTGQVYLPTIVFVSQESATRFEGLQALLVYNVAFVMPMAAVFALVFFGVRTQAVAEVARRHLAKAKLAMSVVFLGLAAVLIFMATGP